MLCFLILENMHSFSSQYDGNFNVYNLMAAVAAVHITTKKPLDEFVKLLRGLQVLVEEWKLFL